MKTRVVVAASFLLAVAGSAMAQSGSAPEMPAIAFPVSIASITTAVVAAGVVIFLAKFGVKIPFKLGNRLGNQVTKTVG